MCVAMFYIALIEKVNFLKCAMILLVKRIEWKDMHLCFVARLRVPTTYHEPHLGVFCYSFAFRRGLKGN